MNVEAMIGQIVHASPSGPVLQACHRQVVKLNSC